jgi:hypothetical protein
VHGKLSPIQVVADGSPAVSPRPDSQTPNWTGRIRSWWPECAILAIFALIVAVAIPYHEPWGDEAIAWQLARSLSLRSLFGTYLGYETSPGLWHLLLWGMIRAHASFTCLHWICGAVAAAASALLLFASPLPRALRLTLPFTYFLIFQYAVNARSYTLAPLLLFLIALCWRKSPLAMALLLGLLANLSLHTAVISGGLAIAYLIRQMRVSPRRGQLIIFAAIVVAFYAFAIWTAWPPHDLTPAQPPGESRPVVLFAIISLFWGICQPWPLSILFWIGIGVCLYARESLLFLLPVVLFAVFSATVYVQFWHMGLLVPLVISLLWITWPEAVRASARFELAGTAAMFLMIATQWVWAGYALVYDHYHDCSGNIAAAEFLKPYVQENATIVTTFIDHPRDQSSNAVGILPYFDRNIFANWPYSFWWWSERNATDRNYFSLLPSHPRIVIVEGHPLRPGGPIDLNKPKIHQLTQMGYRLTNSFCGAVPMRLNLAISGCHLIYQYAGP